MAASLQSDSPNCSPSHSSTLTFAVSLRGLQNYAVMNALRTHCNATLIEDGDGDGAESCYDLQVLPCSPSPRRVIFFKASLLAAAMSASASGDGEGVLDRDMGLDRMLVRAGRMVRAGADNPVTRMHVAHVDKSKIASGSAPEPAGITASASAVDASVGGRRVDSKVSTRADTAASPPLAATLVVLETYSSSGIALEVTPPIEHAQVELERRWGCRGVEVRRAESPLCAAVAAVKWASSGGA